MEVLQNEWKAKCLVRNAAFCQSKGIKRLKRKLEMLTEASDDTAEQKMELEMEITRLESETFKECTQRKEEEDRKKEEARQQKEEARQQNKEEDRKKEEAQQRKEEARQRKKEEDRKKEEARQQKEEVRQRKGLCSHMGCLRSVDARGVCKGHGPRCSHEGCEKDVYSRGVCKKGHDNWADAIRRHSGLFGASNS